MYYSTGTCPFVKTLHN